MIYPDQNQTESYVRKLQNKNKGFTLVELIITLLIGSLLLAWGVPNYRDFKVRKAVVDTSNDILTSLTQARAEAVRYGVNVEVAPIGTWQEGWTVIAKGVDGNADIDIAIHEEIGNQVTLAESGGIAGTIIFNRIGGVSGGLSGQFTIEYAGVDNAKRFVDISPAGIVKVRKP